MIETKNPLFISDALESNDFLPPEEAHHALHVLRLKALDEITITNGNGLVVDAIIEKTTKKEVFFRRLRQFYIPPIFPTLDLLVAPTKNIERYEFMIEKCTEIGFASLTPIICKKSERKEVKIERLERIVNAAVKQSQKAFIPKINRPVAFNDWVGNNNYEGQKFIALCQNISRKDYFDEIKKNINAMIIIGPEGDFSAEETALALSNGFIPVSLGPSRLRTETAGLVACHTFSLMQQYLKNYE